MSKTIIINRILSDSEIKEITRLSKDGAKIFAWSEGVVPDFAQRIDLTPEEKKEINYEMMAEVLRFGDLPVGDQTVAELFSIDNASVWHYHKFRIYFAVRNLMYFLKPLERNFSSFKDHLWFVSPEEKSLQKLFPEVEFRFLKSKQKLTLEVFQSLDKSSGFFLFRYFAARNYFKDSGIKAVVAGDENSPLTKSILDAAKFCGIKVIGLQHGTMNDLHPAYLYTANDCKNRVMPDLTLTWGKYWEEFLINKGNYPKESVISVGQIRTDIIPVLLKAEKEKQAKPIDTIVFASQPQRDPELRCQAAFDVFKEARKLPKAQLIVRLHPRESADSEYYSDIAKVAGCKNYIIDSTSDLYQLIASCNVLITCFSTVGAETIYFYKPLIILDHLSQDIQGYAAEGVAFQATNAGSLTSILSAIFRGTLKVDRAEYDLFIQKYACQIDGKVTERCIEAITSAK